MVDFGATLPYGFDEELTPEGLANVLRRVNENVPAEEREEILAMLGLSDPAASTTTSVA